MAQTRVLADRVVPGEGWTWDALRVLTANILLVLCAWIAVTLPGTPVPVTGQTLGVMLVAVLLGARRSAAVLGLYLLEGLAGLPVFQPFGLPGPARLAGPTGGYLLALPAAAFVIGWLVERGASRSILRLTGALLAGEVVIFAGGCAWLATAYGTGWSRALALGAVPFIVGEVIKIAIVLGVARGAEHTSPGQ